ncbi:glyoxylase-like metal-dependent hydrolase (beta-lactamase superfamily II) [Rhodococcus wratislaviensis]|uniref:Hydroxyacylglutathione hydrolase n=1 Tax=Rhodococcus wratislaviensis TaxID=44752 RepID=A0AB38FDD4_RHOWR|nr:MBL fold metallo-hydrolase [Rhodococcus wratislaviensis]REE75624.1 glyoxylase-like metal-dependent hydrolase (beta-lactamase superfamily II) [Rhodococcus wratislaviensis]SPZ39340.1 hydroxyacylglutathione hydrolase [Rhodococcus wratislaviensis]
MSGVDSGADERLPDWVIWRQRPFPDANLLLIDGREPALVDSGFVGHAQRTAEWVRAHSGNLTRVVNTHWHADHVGGNGLLQAGGAGIAAGAPDADAIARRDPGCCAAEYLDQPVAPYTVDEPLDDGQLLRLGDADWEVLHTPGHTPGHVALWQPEERLLVVGDALSDYDVGWVNLALDGPDAATTAVASLQRLADLEPRVLLPAHGPIPAEPTAAFAAALRRGRRLVDDPDGAIWYGARRIFAFALMIRGGISADEVESHLLARAWLVDAAALLRRTPETLAAELIDTMIRSGAVVVRDNRLHAAAEYSPVMPETLQAPFPRAWPAPAGRRGL